MYYFIEPMQEDDIPAIQAIERESFTIPWSANTYRRELRNREACRYVIARESEQLPQQPPLNAPQRGLAERLSAFFAGLFPHEPAQRNVSIVGYGGIWLTVDDAHITTIAVAPSHRGRGIGELLLNGLIDHAYELQARMLTLEVRVSNYSAQQLYVKYGFQPGGKRKRYYTDNNEDALIMWTDDINAAIYRERLGELRRLLFARLQRQLEEAPVRVVPPVDPL